MLDTQFSDFLGIEFIGTFGIITLNEEGKLFNMYIGEGETLRFGKTILKTSGQSKAAYMENIL